jgi:hypothetical protein
MSRLCGFSETAYYDRHVVALPLCHKSGGNLTLPLKDRRVPYYVLPGCDFMLDAGDRCDIDAVSSLAPAVGCCPMGYDCVPGQAKQALPDQAGLDRTDQVGQD